MNDQVRRRVIICGAAGRDYHNFNTLYRDNPAIEVVAFTATQIPGIADRVYPPELAGSRYPKGIPIVDEDQLIELIRVKDIDDVMFAYSDVTHEHVMHMASRVLAAGAGFLLAGPAETQIVASKPVIAVSAVRTGCGKSQVARYLSVALERKGMRVAAIRHPMPYGMLRKQAVQRFERLADLDAANCTLEEREEYEPHIAAGNLVFAGVDYAAITDAASAEADVLVWDGGNNDMPFLKPDVHVVVVDALRPTQLLTHHPGEAVLRSADIVIVNKAAVAGGDVVAQLCDTLAALLPGVPLVVAHSPVTLERPLPARSRVMVVEDGPTITHGGMTNGAGWQAVKDLDVEIVDPRESASPDIAAVFNQHEHIGCVLPAMGYSPQQVHELRQTINNAIESAGVDRVVTGTPIDLQRLLNLPVPVVRARYEYSDASSPGLLELVLQALSRDNA